jgi:NAD(P)-dependent dehydrogenase (short-subunit alcohol dehydrogenase family)
LKELATKNSNLHILQIDIKNFEQYDRLVKEVGTIVKGQGLNVLFNNAGVSPKSTRLPFVTPEQLLETYQVNSMAPVLLAKVSFSCFSSVFLWVFLFFCIKAFLPLLKKAAHHNSAEPIGAKRALIVNMSSVLGSIASNVEGGLYPYRMTKTGLNAATKSMSIDLKGNDIMAISLHPGWVKTDLGGDKAPMTVEKSCTKMVETLFGLNEQQNGLLLHYNGKVMPW